MKPPPTRVRIVAALALQGLALWGLVRLATGSSPTLAGGALALITGIAAALLIYSSWEWSFHRYLYHRVLAPQLKPIYITHHKEHHYQEFPPWRFTTDAPCGGASAQAHPSVWQQVARRLTHSQVTIPDRWVYLAVGSGGLAGAGWWLTHNFFFCAGIVGAGVVIFKLFGSVHGGIHRPGSHPVLEAQAWFRFLARHHYIHHVDPEANENFLLPLADWFFGTLRLAITEEEEASVEARRDHPTSTTA
jgi:sterol desaturase/sphingolipid hydroxylase (fatty acid hydroxylase superfamily)